MTPDELRERILHWEDPHTDFKREVSSPTELAKDLVCFANGDGGQIIVGVDDPDRLMLAGQSLFYDGQPLPRPGLADLDLEAVHRHLADAGRQDLDDDLPRLLRAWGLYDGSHPTVGGVEVRSPGRPPHIYSRIAKARLGTRAGTGIRRIARLLREHSGQSLGIGISDAAVILTLPKAAG